MGRHGPEAIEDAGLLNIRDAQYRLRMLMDGDRFHRTELQLAPIPNSQITSMPMHYTLILTSDYIPNPNTGTTPPRREYLRWLVTDIPVRRQVNSSEGVERKIYRAPKNHSSTTLFHLTLYQQLGETPSVPPSRKNFRSKSYAISNTLSKAGRINFLLSEQ